MSDKLQVAVLIAHSSVRAFELEIIDKIMKLECCEIVLILDHQNSVIKKPGFLFRWYQKIDRLIYSRSNNYMQTVSLKTDNIRRLSFSSYANKQYQYIDEDTIKAIKDFKLDVVLKFDETVFKGEILSLARYGVWEFSYGKSCTGATLSGLKETISAAKSLQASLIKLPDVNSSSCIIDSFHASSDPLSFFNNQNQLCWKTHLLMPRNIEKLAKNPQSFMRDKLHNLYFYKDKQIVYPDTKEMLLFLPDILVKNIVSRIDRLLYKVQWCIYYAENENEQPFQRNLSNFIKIDTPKDLFWADPFVLDYQQKSYIFFEDYVYKTRKGHISVIEYDHQSKTVSEPKIVINKPYHQSYPFIMNYDNEIYMIPEGSKDRDLKLYKATQFPYEWEIVYRAFENHEIVDATLFFYENRWWLFANMIQEQGQSLNEELYIYYSDDFRTNDWKPHACNPVISSIQSSRPAGKIIKYNGDLYRPSQNSVGGYGYSTNFNKIILLTPEKYEEKFVTEITPDFIPGAKAIHTYNSSGKLTVIDVVHKIRRFF